jgi:hypothetical protein
LHEAAPGADFVALAQARDGLLTDIIAAKQTQPRIDTGAAG